jgi:hypothetical protein
MLNSVLKDAIKNREETLSILRGPKYDQIILAARKNWIDFIPEKQNVTTAGIDSSFNSTKFQGAELWAVTAVSVKSDGQLITDLHNFGLDSNPELAGMASKMEIEACNQTVDSVDLVMTRQHALTKEIIKAVSKKENVIFISKTSNTKKQFEKFGGIAGDIFYYNHATKTAGFSTIFEDSKYGKDKVITSVFARLADSLPLIKIELLGSNYSEGEIKILLNKIYKNSVSGYPYSLKLAHNNCKISGKDLMKLASIHGLSNEIGSREVLR